MQGATWTTLHEMFGLKTATSFIVIAKKDARFAYFKALKDVNEVFEFQDFACYTLELL